MYTCHAVVGCAGALAPQIDQSNNARGCEHRKILRMSFARGCWGVAARQQVPCCCSPDMLTLTDETRPTEKVKPTRDLPWWCGDVCGSIQLSRGSTYNRVLLPGAAAAQCLHRSCWPRYICRSISQCYCILMIDPTCCVRVWFLRLFGPE
mgnify:CR=1 FL=1